ncbi:hypothetical protein FQA39_LY12129 [Lamprigera yunnana]|nr:hypothetical protein FQA39_LY12129 [Lamprigera yunnana]
MDLTYAADKRRGYCQWYYQCRVVGRGGTRRPLREVSVGNEEEGKQPSEGVEAWNRGPPRSDEEQGDGEGRSRGCRPPKRFLRKNFRGGRGEGRGTLSLYGQGMSNWRYNKILNDEDLLAVAEVAAFELENLPLDNDITDEEASEDEEGKVLVVGNMNTCLVVSHIGNSKRHRIRFSARIAKLI